MSGLILFPPQTYEGGYGQSPHCEAQGSCAHIDIYNAIDIELWSGGTTYIAIASLQLASQLPNASYLLSPLERESTIRWLLRNQHDSGGFSGRTGKDADACYCFWCGAALKVCK